MTTKSELTRQAKTLPKSERGEILSGFQETEFQGYLAELLRALNTDYWVAVTHGVHELGKDIVIVRDDPLAPDVIGVVVKRGDIKGKTSGHVDGLQAAISEVLSAKGERLTAEIISQIRQAHSHEAELATHLQRLRINKVLVVLVGEMSGNARTRLEKEVLPHGAIYDLPWLVEHFTEHYPQVFFEGRAVDFLDSMIQNLEEDAFYRKVGKTLSECFVDPVLSRMDDNLALDDLTLSIKLKSKKVRFADLESVATAKKRLLLLGEPGSGKSKAVAKLCIDCYRNSLAQLTRRNSPGAQHEIPVMISARRIVEFASIDELLNILLPLEVRGRFKIRTLIIDGLDEVPADQRETVLEMAQKCSEMVESCLLVTSRKIGSLNAPRPGFSRYELLPLEFSQAIKLMQKMLANVSSLPALRDGLQRIKAQIPMNPLSLLLLVELVSEHREVPSSTTELYERFLDLVCGRSDQEKGIQVLFDYVIKKKFLSTLAYREFHLKNRLELGATEFHAFVSEYSSLYGWDGEQISVFLREMERAGILSFHAEVFFSHRAFLDYFVALYVYDQRTGFADLDGTVVELYFDGLWSEVALFFAGLGREVSPALLQRIFSYEQKGYEGHIQKLLAGRLLQAGWHSQTAVKEDGIRHVLEQVPLAASDVRELLKDGKFEGAELYGEMLTAILTESSLGSAFLSNEAERVLLECEEKGARTSSALLQQACLLWATRRRSAENVQNASIERYLTAVDGAGLEPLVEARLLLLGAITDTSNQLLWKAVERRLKRLAKRAPGALGPLFPKTKKGFRPSAGR